MQILLVRDENMSQTTANSITFRYSEEDKRLFKDDQKQRWKSIEHFYQKLRERCLEEVDIPISASHKAWISARVNLHITTSLMRLLYLTESLRDASINFNSVAAAIHIKAMVEIPLHLGYLVWILDGHGDFQSIRRELSKIAFGNRDKQTGLTASNKISQRTFYTRSDAMIKKFFKDEPSNINIFETLYKEANATGHHNYEARNLLCGVQNNDVWCVKDRKEWFVFISNNIFQFFMHCEAILGMSQVFLETIDHYVSQLPENFSKESNIAIGKQKFLEIKGFFKRLSDEMCNVVQAYYLWSALAFARSIPEAGKEHAEENVMIMNRHKHFFIQTEDSHLRAFIIGISKFFDRDQRSLSIKRLIEKIEESKDFITPEVVLEVYPDRFNGDEVIHYTPLEDGDIQYIESLRADHEVVIQKLKEIRDKRLAHTSIEIIKGTFVPNEVEKLIIAIQEMFNKLSSRFDQSTTRWDHLKEGAVMDTELLLRSLKMGEMQRIAKIEKEYKQKTNESSS